MTPPYRGCDADMDPTESQAQAMADAGFSFFCGYLKTLTSQGVRNLADAGLKIIAIWETTAGRSLQGEEAGEEDARLAWTKMVGLGAPAGAMVMFTTDADVDPAAVHPYYQGARNELATEPGNAPTLGIYAEGAIEEAEGATGRWLAGALGWEGSRNYGNATLIQGPTLTRGGVWSGHTWPDLGFAYDPDLALVEEYGAWTPSPVA